MRRLASLFWLVGLSVSSLAMSSEQIQLANINFSAIRAEQIAMDLSAATPHRYFVLDNPYRLVVDIENTQASKALTQPPIDHPLIVGVRSGSRNNKDLRVVFELKANATVKAKAIGSHLQFDLSPKQSDVKAEKVLSASSTPPVTVPVPKKPVTESVALIPKTSLAKPIDAGHGGKDVGAQGSNGTQEKDVVFAIAKRLQSLVNHQPGMKAVMIRNGDYFVKLRERVRIAQKANADLFVSIHADAFSDESAHGASVYTLANKGATSAGARFLADSENAADAISGGVGDKDEALASVLMDLSATAAKESSLNVATNVLRSVKTVGHLHRANVQKAGFVVLKSAEIPSILVETAFISNPDEERRLTTRAYQDKMASALMGGITSHFKQYAPANTLFAQLSKTGKVSTRIAMSEITEEPVATSISKPKTNQSDNPSSENIVRMDMDAVPVPVQASNEVKPASSQSQHIIGRGETLSGIAQQYGVSMRQLRLSNGMTDGNVRVGQVLQIPRNS
jgi:N-acetylmuramoyl-L-alanine amidase